jgi:hypothetical protein
VKTVNDLDTQIIVVTPDGRLKFVWDDALAELCSHGQANVRRVADVEPTEIGEWTADCRRIGGGVYGPYPLRETALQHERAIVTGRLMTGQL